MEAQNWRVTGTYEGAEIDESVEAYSSVQAKLKAGMSLGLSPQENEKFRKSTKIRVSRR
jgi:hypothetical protein